jgi:cell division protease FtsH
LETWAVLAILLLVLAYAGVLEMARPHVDGDRLRYDVYVNLVNDGHVRDGRVLDADAFVIGTYVRADGVTARYNAPLLQGSQNEILNLLVENRVPATVDQQVRKKIVNLASVLLPALILVVLFGYLILSHRRGSGLFAIKSGATHVEGQQVAVTFDDVAGQEAAVVEMRELKEFLAHPTRFEALGAAVPKGILLYGPPGSGKTLLAKALAGEAGANFFSISGSDFVEVYVGVGASRVRQLFRQARENTPSVIFIDELDSVGRARSGTGIVAGHGEQEQTLNQILAEMDGFPNQAGVIVLAATNRPDVLDPALLRPGRFDRTIGLERPDEQARLAILKLHARTKTLDEGVDLGAIARRAIGLTGADLASVLNEGALLAVRAGKAAISQTELSRALQRILESPDRQRRLALRDRSIGTRFSSEDRVTFADVAGAEEVIVELAELRDYLAWPDRFARLGARAPRGVLMSGPPGCGKTLLARAVAGEANAAFISVASSEFVELYAGAGAARVRDLFAEARALAPAIVFLDEVDAIGARRGSAPDGHREREQTLNQILVELDGFDTGSAVIVVAATNRPDILDPALIRPGRFDRHLVVAPPDRAGRLAILKLHAIGKPLAEDVDLAGIAALTRGFSGADLANLLNEGALLAARRGLDELPHEVLDESIDRSRIGVTRRALAVSDAELRLTAYHEAGHALVALSLPGAGTPHKLTVVARGSTGGHCSFADPYDTVIWTKAVLLDHMAALLGGRVAEELVFGNPTSAAAADLRQVTDLATRMVGEFAMTDSLGPVAYPRPGSMDGSQPSEAVAAMIDAEIRTLVQQAQASAREILGGARPALDRVAEGLLAAETLSAAQLDQLVRPPAPSRASRTRSRAAAGFPAAVPSPPARLRGDT